MRLLTRLIFHRKRKPLTSIHSYPTSWLTTFEKSSCHLIGNVMNHFQYKFESNLTEIGSHGPKRKNDSKETRKIVHYSKDCDNRIKRCMKLTPIKHTSSSLHTVLFGLLIDGGQCGTLPSQKLASLHPLSSLHFTPNCNWHSFVQQGPCAFNKNM